MKKSSIRAAGWLALIALWGAGCDVSPIASDPPATETADTSPSLSEASDPAPIAPQPRTEELGVLPEACADLLTDPALLIELSEAAWRDHNAELGYRYAALVRQLHPQSPQATQAYEFTAPALRHLYSAPDSDARSKWRNAELVFMMEWLADIYAAAGDRFPEAEANLLLVGASKPMRLQFEEYARSHPLLSRHPLRFKMENGVVEYVELAR